MGVPLRRTESFLALEDLADCASSQAHLSSRASTTLSLRHPRERRKFAAHFAQDMTTTCAAATDFVSSASASRPVVNFPKASQSSLSSYRSSSRIQASTGIPRCSSPLSPRRTLLPPRASFPRSKPEPDLYRLAITTRMKSGPEGSKILRMGPRLALSIMTATRELERIVAGQTERDPARADAEEYSPVDASTTNSWVSVSVPYEDWEMVNCAS